MMPYGRGRTAKRAGAPPRFAVWPSLQHPLESCPRRQAQRGCGAVGSASPCQGEGREFESRHPLEWELRPHGRTRWRGREARQRPAKPYTRVRIPSPPHSPLRLTTESGPVHPARAIGAAVARFPDTEEVTGSIPVSPTEENPWSRASFSAARCVPASSIAVAAERRRQAHRNRTKRMRPRLRGDSRFR